jgi:glutathione synthase/RimK-type ligase-like ATP-grasp enzyme
MEVWLLTEHQYAGRSPEQKDLPGYMYNVLLEDDCVLKALELKGVKGRKVDWADDQLDWGQPDALLFRTTWDYFERWPEFSSWLDDASLESTLLNDATIVRWNLNKKYLLDLERFGLRIVPTAVWEEGESVSLSHAMSDIDSDDVVIKPLVSGAAMDTHRVHGHVDLLTVTPTDPKGRSAQELWMHLLRRQGMMVQPFLPSVAQHGEISVIWVHGKVTHAVHKRAKEGDFRVQDDHGGTVHRHELQKDELAFAIRTMDVCQEWLQSHDMPPPLYARIDMVIDLDGEWALSELEMVEPELWFRFHPEAADELATGLVHMLSPQIPGQDRTNTGA